jgi:hypothetical protein
MKNIGRISSEDGDRVRAHIINGIDFTTSLPFYAGNTKMPALTN